ncbi:MAG: hypothetical protein NXI10_13925 [bacterium]|nr:hypothetical protein [bacterium]
MKRILFFIFCSVAITTNAQQKETVYSIVEEIHDKSWYETQFQLWEKEALEGLNTPNAWYNYYAACRALINLSENEERSKYAERGKEIAKEFLELHEGTFEAHYVAMWSSGLSNKATDQMWKAYKINPDDPRLFDDLLIAYEIEQNATKRLEMAQKMIGSNYLANGVMQWGYNVLSEVQENGIVLSAGDNDTYALWLNNYGMNHRPDVTILNIHMLFLPEYREKNFNSLGIPPIETDKPSLSEVIAHVMRNTKDQPVHIATTAYHCLEDASIDSNLYLTGLTYQYSEKPLDNHSLLRRNFEQRFMLDYLKVKFTTHQMDQIAQSFDATYLASMVKLYKMYEATGESRKMNELAVLMEKVGENSEMSEEIQKIIH